MLSVYIAVQAPARLQRIGEEMMVVSVYFGIFISFSLSVLSDMVCLYSVARLVSKNNQTHT